LARKGWESVSFIYIGRWGHSYGHLRVDSGWILVLVVSLTVAR